MAMDRVLPNESRFSTSTGVDATVTIQGRQFGSIHYHHPPLIGVVMVKECPFVGHDEDRAVPRVVKNHWSLLRLLIVSELLVCLFLYTIVDFVCLSVSSLCCSF